VEISVFVLGVLFEKARPDLRLRAWWARHGAGRVSRLGTGLHRVPLPVALAGFDARRLLLRPSALLAAYVLFRVFSVGYDDKAYEGVNHLVGFTLAILGLVVLALVASIGGRDRGVELVEATPARRRPALMSWVVLLVAAAVLEYVLLVLARYVPAPPAYAELLPNAWQLAQGPILLVGGGLLGLLAARLLPSWVAPVVAMVVGVAWVGIFSANLGIPMLAPVIEWIQYHEDNRVLLEPGSFAWHNAYLLGLCGLGVVAVLLTVPGRRRALLVAGGALALATGVAGVLALP
jgi:hypothetical protein